MKTKTIIFYLASIICLFNSCDSKMSMDTERDLIEQKVDAGNEHNEFLENVIYSIKVRDIKTRGINDDATTFTNHMTDVGIQVMKAFKKSGITDKRKVDQFVQETLNYALNQDILRVKDNVSGGNISLVTILSQVYGNDFTEVLRGYTRDMDNLFAQNLENVEFTNKATLIKNNWYRQGNAFERKVISSASSIAMGSVDYWLNNATVWNEQIKTWGWATAKKVLNNVARTDFCTALAFCTKLKGATAALWKEVAITAGVASAIDGIATLIFDNGIFFTKNTNNEDVCIINGHEFSLSELKLDIYSQYLDETEHE